MTATTYPKSLGASSVKYGPCEVCRTHVTEMFIAPDGRNDYLFGHQTCLARAIDARKEAA